MPKAPKSLHITTQQWLMKWALDRDLALFETWTPLSNVTWASLLIEWKLTAKAELNWKSTKINLEENAVLSVVKTAFTCTPALTFQ